jgi:hypothetical protein
MSGISPGSPDRLTDTHALGCPHLSSARAGVHVTNATGVVRSSASSALVVTPSVVNRNVVGSNPT